jgi:hypothetical protein
MADSSETVRLTDLEVIQQFSLAVRGATASRAEVIAALESDLAFLKSSRPAATKPAAEAAAPEPAAKKTPAKKSPAKKATRARGA